MKITVHQLALLLGSLLQGHGAVVQEDARVQGLSGGLRYSFDDSMSSSACDNVVMIGVGTAMGTAGYDLLSTQIVENEPVVSIIVDQNPFWFVKTSETRFARFTNAIIDQLGDIIPVCEGVSPKQIIVGGHSAGGQAAWNAIPLLNFEPAGFLGLDPFRLDPSDNIAIPALFWGFKETSCQVTASQAAKAGYQAANEDNRVFYQIDNTNGSDAGHCSFTDSGCVGPICPARETSSTWVRQSVAQATNRFLKAIADNAWSKESFVLQPTEGEDATLYFNEEIIARRVRFLRGRF